MTGGEGDNRGWDSWMASPTRWSWVWVSSGSWWWTGKPGMLQSMGPQRVGHHWATELSWGLKQEIYKMGLGYLIEPERKEVLRNSQWWGTSKGQGASWRANGQNGNNLSNTIKHSMNYNPQYEMPIGLYWCKGRIEIKTWGSTDKSPGQKHFKDFVHILCPPGGGA